MKISYDENDSRLSWIADFPEDMVNGEMIDKLHKELSPKYIFYRRHSWGADCYCTNCMKRYEARKDADPITPIGTALSQLSDSIKDGGSVECPYCGASGKARSAGRSRRNMYSEYHITKYHVSADGETIYGICGIFYPNLSRMNPEEPSEIHVAPEFEDFWIFRITRNSADMAFYHSYYRMYMYEKFREPYIGTFCNYVHFNYYYLGSEDINNSFLRYSAESILKKYKQTSAMALYALHPQVEMLDKQGLGVIADSILCGEAYKSIINLDGKSPAQLFKLDGNRAAELIRYLHKNGGVYSFDIIKAYKKLLKYDSKIKIEYAEEFFRKYIRNNHRRDRDIKNVYKLMELTGITPHKLDNYINRLYEESISAQNQCCHAAYYLQPTHQRLLNNYYDYIEQCKRLGYDLTDNQINRPKNFSAAHERASEAIRALEREIAAKAEAKAARNYRRRNYNLNKRYGYRGEVYSILVPWGADDIVKEGAAQHNCVGGYAKRHIEGTTTILFLRRNEDISKSFGTLEIKTDSKGKAYFVQAYAERNTQLPDDAKAFLDKWLNEYANRPGWNKKQVKTA